MSSAQETVKEQNFWARCSASGLLALSLLSTKATLSWMRSFRLVFLDKIPANGNRWGIQFDGLHFRFTATVKNSAELGFQP